MNQKKEVTLENPDPKEYQSPIEYRVINQRAENLQFELNQINPFDNQYPQSVNLEIPVKTGLDLKNMEYQLKRSFVVKVFTLLSIQLLIALFLGLIAYYNENFFWVILNYKGIFLWAALFLAAGTLIAIFFFQKLARRVPFNYMAFFLFTFFASFFLISICCIIIDYFGSNGGFVVFTSSVMSIVLTISLGIYAQFSHNQFSYKGGIITSIISIIIVFLIICWFNLTMILFNIISIIGVLLYGQQSMARSLIFKYLFQRHELTIDDYIIGPLLFYIDIVYVFLKLMYCIVICLFCCLQK